MESNGWFPCTLGEQVVLQRGYDISKQEQTAGEVPVISSGGTKSYHNEAKENGPGVLLGRKGTVGTVYYTKKDYWPHSTTLFVKDFCGNNPRFVYYYFLSIKELLKNMDVGTSNPTLNRNHLHPMKIWWPCNTIQDQIAGILSMLDDKIELNHKINENLERQEFALFENLLADAPDEECVISDIAILNPRRSIAKNQLAKCIDMAHLPTSGAFPTGWETKPFNGGIKFSNGDTLLARITPCLENGKTAFIDFLEDGEVAFGSTEYIVLSPKGGIPPEFLYCLARYPLFVDYAVKNMNGSSGRQRVSADTVGQYCLPKLSCEDFEGFGNAVAPLFLKMRYNSLENMRLSALRDTLLPKLMSGEIDVSNVQF